MTKIVDEAAWSRANRSMLWTDDPIIRGTIKAKDLDTALSKVIYFNSRIAPPEPLERLWMSDGSYELYPNDVVVRRWIEQKDLPAVIAVYRDSYRQHQFYRG